MSRELRLLAISVAALGAAGVAALIDPDTSLIELVVLGAALVAAELFELRPVARAPLPLSFAILVVLVRAATPREFVLLVVAGYAAAVAVRPAPSAFPNRLVLYVERLVEAGAVIGAYRLVESSPNPASEGVVLGALAAAAVAPILVADLFVAVRERRVGSLRDRGADLALSTSAMLMAIGYAGINGDGRLGLWGPLLFSIPLFAAWYSFELLASTRKHFRQTVRALGVAPELGGLVRPGHAERAALLAVAMGEELRLSRVQLDDLETAALLHHLGVVCLDEPAAGQHHDPLAVARTGAAMLRASEALSPAGDIVASEPSLHRPPERSESSATLAGQILKVASAYDELTEGNDEHADWAVEALYTGPGYVYDGRVLGALERVLERRGIPVARV